MERKRYEGKTVLVTGGAGGIGEATALAFAREGATVVVLDRDERAVRRVADLIQATGSAGYSVQADLSTEADVVQAVRQTLDIAGKV